MFSCFAKLHPVESSIRVLAEMGKKTAKERKEKKKAPSETNSRGEERALRKAAQYQQSKNKKEANYNEEVTEQNTYYLFQ